MAPVFVKDFWTINKNLEAIYLKIFMVDDHNSQNISWLVCKIHGEKIASPRMVDFLK